MRALSLSLTLLAAVANIPASFAVDFRQVKEWHKRSVDMRSGAYFDAPRPEHNIERRSSLIPEAYNVSKYVVNGKALPNVTFDIGESYAGLMPVSKKKGETRQLYFWFFPSTNPLAKDEITIWLNGGPGCSSLEGFFQENGPVIWQYGTFQPVPNPWTWVNLTNMIWVEQPVGTGFSQGDSHVNHNETIVAAEFLGFFKNFIDTFGLYNKKIFIAGESYAGYYVPYIADAMLDKKDKKYYDLNSILIYDPSLSSDTVQTQIPVVPFVDYHSNLFNFNKTFLDSIHQRADKCGYTSFFNKYLTFPPPGIMPAPPNANAAGCDIFDDVFYAITDLNPCFDIYQIATTCPLLWDVLGFPGSIPYLPDGATVYFNRSDVQKVINAPLGEWDECAPDSKGVLDPDTSLPSSLSVLPGVIERANRTIIVHGTLDMVLIGNGSLLAIQNMTWGGKQGFQSRPANEFFVPFHFDYSLSTVAGEGIMGRWHTERKLTWVETFLSGHMVPQYAPSAAYRQVEFLLGRISNLSQNSSFTTRLGDGLNPSYNASMRLV